MNEGQRSGKHYFLRRHAESQERASSFFAKKDRVQEIVTSLFVGKYKGPRKNVAGAEGSTCINGVTQKRMKGQEQRVFDSRAKCSQKKECGVIQGSTFVFTEEIKHEAK